MIDRGVWRKTDRKNIPNNRRLIGNKWVFKIKRDGTYRARLVELGYSQIPGMDYKDNFAPVAHDVSFRIALARRMVEKLDSFVMDVETVFYMEISKKKSSLRSPGGMEEIVTEVCYLLEVSWQMCHAWITHWTVARAVLTMSRRRSTRDERTHGRDAREPLLACTRAYLAPRGPAFGS